MTATPRRKTPARGAQRAVRARTDPDGTHPIPERAPAVCGRCGASDARPYPAGPRCDTCRPDYRTFARQTWGIQ